MEKKHLPDSGDEFCCCWSWALDKRVDSKPDTPLSLEQLLLGNLLTWQAGQDQEESGPSTCSEEYSTVVRPMQEQCC